MAEQADESSGIAAPPPTQQFTPQSQPSYGRRTDPIGQYLNMSAIELKRLPRAAKIEVLRELRVHPLRCPQLVSLCVTELVGNGNGGGDLRDERWLVLEQGVWAALECGRSVTAQEYWVILKNKFGNKSIRVRRLFGVIREAQGMFNKAQDIYQSILHDAPNDSFVAKRLAAMHKAKGEYSQAIMTLESLPVYCDPVDNEKYTFLDHYRGTDEAAMRELVHLNYLVGSISRALFFAEEVIMLDPHNFANHTRHAEFCYAAGTLERAAAAFAHSLTLNDSENNARAMYGLWLTALELGKHSSSRTASSSGVQLKDIKSLQQLAATKLKSLYTGSPQFPRLTLLLQCNP